MSLIASIFMSLVLDQKSSVDALKNSKVLYITAMFWIGVHFAYLVAVTLFVPSLIVCFPCVVVGLRWLFHLPPPGAGRNNRRPLADEALERIWKATYHAASSSDNPDSPSYSNPSNPNQHLPAIPKEDTKCSICLAWYEEGEELRILPCLHHFHRECADHWLRITASCPLCVQSAIPTESGDSNV
jgi:hypothetical protein